MKGPWRVELRWGRSIGRGVAFLSSILNDLDTIDCYIAKSCGCGY